MQDEGLGSAKIPIRPDLEGLEPELEKARGKIEGKLNGVFSKLSKTLAKVGKAAIVGGLAGITAGVAVMTAGLASSTKAAMAEQEGIAQLGASVRATGADWNVAEAAIEDYLAAELKRTALDDGDGREAISRLTNATGDYTKALELMPIAQDLARAKNIELSAAAEIVGKVSAGNVGILGRYGIVLEEGATSTEALAAMQGKFAGQAEAYGNTAAGAMDKWQITMGNLKETIGAKLLPVVAKAGDLLATALNSPKVQGFITTITDGLGRAIDVMGLVVSGVGKLKDAFWSFEEGGFDPKVIAEVLGGFGLDTGAIERVQEIIWGISSAIYAFTEGGTGLEKIGGLIGSIAESFGLWEFSWEPITKISNVINDNLTPILIGLGAMLAAVVVPAFIAWAGAALAAGAATLVAIAPLVAIGAAVALLAAAWMNDWGGIRTYLTDLWTNTLQPIFATLVEWLQTNIPIALAALSSFWTDTLLPAINAVWAFIQDNIVPLFIAIVDVYIAAFNLAITALAGLWQNVLLPALQAAAGFITETVVPALTEAWSWLSEKLSPAVETVKGWFDKLKDSSGGLAGIITTVTDKIRGLAEKLGAIKLPDWLTPGSPTPFEWGLRGIAASLGPVIDGMLDFARSIGGPQAQAMKNVASAFKDMAKGIDEIAGAMGKIGSFQGGGGGGGAGGFSAMLDQFAVIATEAAARIDAITSAIGYNRIHKLKLTAGRLTEIIQAVLVDLSGIVAREFPDLAVWFAQFQDIIQRALVVVNAIYGKYGLAVVQRAAEIATALGTVLQLLGADLANIVPPPINFEVLLIAFLAALAVAAEAMIPWLAGVRATFSGPVLDEAVKTAEALGAIIGVLSLATILADLSKDENKPGEGLTTLVQNVLDGLKGALEILVPGLEEIETRWGEALKRLAGVTDTMRQFFTGIKDANAAAIEFSKAEEIDLNGLMRRIGSLNAATGAAITGLTAPTPGGPGAEQGGGGGVTVNLYMEGQLVGSYTQQTNDAGQVDIRLGEMMSAS